MQQMMQGMGPRGPQLDHPLLQLMQLLHVLQGPRMAQPQPRPGTAPPPPMDMMNRRPAMPMRGYATGGIAGLYGPEVAQLGEVGPEAVVPLQSGPFAPQRTSSSPWLAAKGPPPNPAAQPGFDPNNPFAGTYTRPLNTSEDIMGYLLRQGAQGGMFGQQGDPRITAMLRSQALQDATAQGRANRLGLLGRSSVDPSTFGFQSLMSDLNTQGQTANAMNQATLQQALAAQDWYRNLFGGSAMGTQGYQNQRELAAQQEAYAKEARKKSILNQIAGAAGTAAGAFFGGGAGGAAGGAGGFPSWNGSSGYL
jgi:hypothetical protein